MPHKQLFFRDEARQKIVRGVATLADAVRVTLGPKLKCVLIGKKWGRPFVCNDGVTIAKEVSATSLRRPGALRVPARFWVRYLLRSEESDPTRPRNRSRFRNRQATSCFPAEGGMAE